MGDLDVMDGTDAWPAIEGAETLVGFEEHRLLTQRALQKALARFQKRYFHGHEKVLEIGSGLGFLRENWPSTFKGQWVQLEAQGAFLEQAAPLFPAEAYVQASAYALPFADHSFDVIGGYGSFDVFSTLEKAVQEVDRVLRPGGLFFHLLDVGANHDVIRKKFEQNRIPLSITRNHSEPYFMGMPSREKWNLEYIPRDHIPAFLEEVGMTSEEMEARPRITGDFAYPAYVRKKRQQTGKDAGPPPSDALRDSDKNLLDPQGDIIELYQEYEAVFQRHARKVDATTYFRDAMVTEFSARFGEKKVTASKLSAIYRGKRTEYQERKYPSCFAFQRDIGLFHPGLCTLLQWPIYNIYQMAVAKNYRWAHVVEPTCTEIQTLDVVVARKP